MKKRIYYTIFHSPIGLIYIASTNKGICHISLLDRGEGCFADSLRERYDCIPERKDDLFRLLSRDLNRYFDGYPVSFRYNTDLLEKGEFMKNVWKRLMGIPYGETRSYQWVAEQIGSPKACRAVGSANGKNPIPIIIPCHRVIQKNGLLGGYTGGIDIKKRLLEIERHGHSK